MGIIKASLTVMFEEPFWIALYEREYGGRYEVCKVTFGAEPKDAQVYDFFLRNYNHLRFSPSTAAEQTDDRRINPKRLQRQIKRSIESCAGIGTKAQQALNLQHEQNKLERKVRSKEMRSAQLERRFELRQEKKKQKHRGR